jgi:hypothetical protein
MLCHTPAVFPLRGARLTGGRARLAATRLFETAEGAIAARSPADPSAFPNNDDGALGWALSWRMQAYALMAEATLDPAYARRLAHVADQVLTVRDTDRGVLDHRGSCQPVWSSAGRYTVTTATIPDTNGADALRVHLCPPGTKGATVQVTPTADGRFDLTLNRADPHPPILLQQLSLAPTDDRRADRIAYAQYKAYSPVTVELVTAPAVAQPSDHRPDTARRIQPGNYPCRPARVALAAQTGMITYPLASLARLARERPDIVPGDAAARTDCYLEAAHDALAAHDYQWRTTDDGGGHYVWLPDEPVSFAGAELPTNEFLAVGRTLIQLAAATGDRQYVDRAAAMARTMRGQLRLEGGAFVWPYWPSFGRLHNGWKRTGDPVEDGSSYRPHFHAVTRAEDVTHSLIDIDFVVLYRSTPGLPEVFTDSDMRILAGTFLRHVSVRRIGRRPTVRRDISVNGKAGTARHEAQVPSWFPLHRWNPAVARAVSAVHTRRRLVPPAPVDTYCAAILARWS